MEYNNVWTTPGDSSSEAEDSSSKAQDSSSKPGESSEKADSSSMPDKPALGDVNGDGNIDIEDAVKIISHVTGQTALTDNEASRADIDSNDAVAVISHINGISPIG